MKITTLLCCGILIFLAICQTVYALFSFPLLTFLCFGNEIAVRSLLSLGGVAALWLLFWLVAFRPTKPLS